MIEGEELVPAPTSLEVVMEDPENQDAVAVLIEISDPKPRAVRVNITIDERTLAGIHEHAEIQGLSRSSFLALAARRELERSA